METLVKRKCRICKKSFQVRATELKRREPKYCSSRCYGQSRILSPKERARRKAAYNKKYYDERKKLLASINQSS